MASQRQGRIILVAGALVIVGSIVGVGLYNSYRAPNYGNVIGRPVSGTGRQALPFMPRPFAPRPRLLGPGPDKGALAELLLDPDADKGALAELLGIQPEANPKGAAGAAAGPKPGTKRDPAGINILLLVVDTERADYTMPYGSEQETTPFLAKLAKDGVTFKNVFSPASWTAPAMFSLITGKYPSEHGVTDGLANGMGPLRGTSGQPVLPPEALTLAEILKGQGYTTFGVNTNLHLNSQSGFSQGFDRFYGEGFAESSYANMVMKSISGDYKSAPKAFLWLHYLDPHYPYQPEPPWFSEWNDTRFRTTSDFSTELVSVFLHRQLKIPEDQPLDASYAEKVYQYAKFVTANQHILSFAVNLIDPDLNHDYVRFVRAGYLSEIRHTDEEMQLAVADLVADDRTLVIYTSDHGEEIFDHGQCGHRQSLTQDQLHVPLVIRLPGKQHAGAVVDTPVSLVDILPTMLDLVGIAKPSGLSGESLAPLIEGKTIAERPLYTEVNNKTGKHRCIIEYPWKYIHSMSNEGESRSQLYNLADDPREAKNLVDAEPGRTKDMQKRLLAWLKNAKPNWSTDQLMQLNPEQMRQLKALGYVQ